VRHNPGGAELGWVRQAQASVREARRLLAAGSAKTLEEAAPHIQVASRCLEMLEGALRSRGARPVASELAAELGDVRKEVARATALLEGAARFHFGWARLLYAAACGYTACGQPAAPGPVRRLLIEG
jgi:hypothetical protein